MKISPHLLAHIKQLEISTRRLLKGSLLGAARSKIKGTGFEFDQIRDYQVGDDVRSIDWKSSARMNKPLVKQCVEERTKTIFIAVDVSSSSMTGSDLYNKWLMHIDIAAVLALVGGYCNDQVGLILFSDTIELYIPPVRGRYRAQFLMQTLFTYSLSKHKKTNMNALLQYSASLRKKNSMLLIISDFIDDFSQDYLSIVGKMYDTIVIRCLTAQERLLSSCGFLTMNDIETGQQQLIDLRASKIDAINALLKKRCDDQTKFFMRCGVDILDIERGENYCSDLVAFFQKRIGSF